jgi:hypothetical protein
MSLNVSPHDWLSERSHFRNYLVYIKKLHFILQIALLIRVYITDTIQLYPVVPPGLFKPKCNHVGFCPERGRSKISPREALLFPGLLVRLLTLRMFTEAFVALLLIGTDI